MNTEEPKDYIDLVEVCKRIWANRKQFYIVWPITFVVACIIILPVPRTYVSQTVVSPESSNTSSLGSLASIASSFGINLGNIENHDALFPDLYPDIVSTNEFIVGLFDVPVHSIDGEINTDYYTYMHDYQKTAYYKYPKKWLFKLKNAIIPKKKYAGTGENGKIDPNWLDYETNDMVQKISEQIGCSVDKKTGVITISFQAQDPLICAMMTDTIRERLQNVITDYRTRKARIDADYYHQLLVEAETEFAKADDTYSKFCDANWNVTTQTVNSQKERLENDRELKKNTYNALLSQYQIALAKVQERTPVYTIMSAPNVPIKASKPKRVIFVLFMLVLSTLGVIFNQFKEEVVEQIKHMR